MEKRVLAKPDVSVTVLGFGAMEIPKLSGSEATALLNKVLDSGINFIDTSPCYGTSEEMIGNGIPNRRNEYFLSSKCCCNTTGVGPGHIFDRATAMKNIDNSLKVMKTDHLDILQLHAPMPSDLPGGPKDDLVAALYDMKKAGKIRHASITFKNSGPGDPKYPAIYGYECLNAFMDWGVFDTMQTVYGGLVRYSELAIAKAAKKGIGIIIRGALKRYFPNYDELYDKAGLDALAGGEDRNSFLLRYALTGAGVSTVIVGTKDAAHLKANIDAAEKGVLPADVYKKAQEKLAAVGSTPQAV
ncbi:aldo/keto reductase [Spirochaetia bacterium]|nr:aldo/keto reductase [Spirochaetia bacterium]